MTVPTFRLRVNELLELPTESARVTDIQNQISRLGVLEQSRLLTLAADELALQDTRVDESSTVAFAKVLVGLLPRSLDLIAEVLSRPADSATSELQFSVFVFLGEWRALRGADRWSEPLLRLIEEYLQSVSSTRAHAAWMAGDLLGDHWPSSESLPILLRLATQAHFVAGREGALHGLSHALERVSKAEQWSIMAVLRKVSRSDRSKAVQRYASAIMADLRGV